MQTIIIKNETTNISVKRVCIIKQSIDMNLELKMENIYF